MTDTTLYDAFDIIKKLDSLSRYIDYFIKMKNGLFSDDSLKEILVEYGNNDILPFREFPNETIKEVLLFYYDFYKKEYIKNLTKLKTIYPKYENTKYFTEEKLDEIFSFQKDIKHIPFFRSAPLVKDNSYFYYCKDLKDKIKTVKDDLANIKKCISGEIFIKNKPNSKAEMFKLSIIGSYSLTNIPFTEEQFKPVAYILYNSRCKSLKELENLDNYDKDIESKKSKNNIPDISWE